MTTFFGGFLRRSGSCGGGQSPPPRRSYPLGMFERFSEEAREVVVLAQDEARELRHNNIGTEHLLLGLLRQADGVAARVLVGLGVALEPARDEVAKIIGQGDD